MTAAELALATFLRPGHLVLVVGNGPRAAQAQRLAAELVRVEVDARSLTADATAITAIANDYGFDQVYARQVQAMARPGAALLVLAGREPSRSLDEAVRTARHAGLDVTVIWEAGAGELDLDSLLLAIRRDERERGQCPLTSESTG